MKQAIVKFNINVPDDFEIGECKKCPFHSTSTIEYYAGCYEEKSYCNLKHNATTCPIRLSKDIEQLIVDERNDKEKSVDEAMEMLKKHFLQWQ